MNSIIIWRCSSFCYDTKQRYMECDETKMHSMNFLTFFLSTELTKKKSCLIINAVIISLEMFVRLDANVIIALLMLYHPLQISKYINHFSLYLYLSFLMCIIYTNINFYFVHCNIIWHRHHPNHQTLWLTEWKMHFELLLVAISNSPRLNKTFFWSNICG